MKTKTNFLRATIKALGITVLILAFALWPAPARSAQKDLVLFSNDAPLGLMMSQAHRDASTWASVIGGEGYWNDLNWIGSAEPAFFNLQWLSMEILSFLFFGSFFFLVFEVWAVVKVVYSYAAAMQRWGGLLSVPLILLAVNEVYHYPHITFRLLFYFAVLFLVRAFVESSPDGSNPAAEGGTP